MKIWCLTIRDDYEYDPYDLDALYSISPYSNCQGLVIIASTEQEAREIATKADDYEGNATWWMDSAVTDCVEVNTGGPSRVVLGNYPTG